MKKLGTSQCTHSNKVCLMELQCSGLTRCWQRVTQPHRRTPRSGTLSAKWQFQEEIEKLIKFLVYRECWKFGLRLKILVIVIEHLSVYNFNAEWKRNWEDIRAERLKTSHELLVDHGDGYAALYEFEKSMEIPHENTLRMVLLQTTWVFSNLSVQ